MELFTKSSSFESVDEVWLEDLKLKWHVQHLARAHALSSNENGSAFDDRAHGNSLNAVKIHLMPETSALKELHHNENSERNSVSFGCPTIPVPII
jgi:hypothetical protein